MIGKKCKLRPLKTEDATISIEWRNKPNLRERVMGYRYPVTEQMEQKWYENALNHNNKNEAFYGIESLETQKLIGIIQLNRIDWISRVAYLGIIIGETSEQNKGIGTEAVEMLLKQAFNVFNLRKVCIEVAEYNNLAFGFWKKLGFKEEGCLKRQLFLNGNYYDLHLMAVYQK